jgi:hypothetical protein
MGLPMHSAKVVLANGISRYVQFEGYDSIPVYDLLEEFETVEQASISLDQMGVISIGLVNESGS